MAGNEHQAKKVVADVIVESRIEVGHRGVLPGFELVTQLLMLALEELVAAQSVDGAMLGGCHQPGSRFVGHAGFRPLLERSNERVLREILGDPDVTDYARQTANESSRLDLPDRLDGAMCIGSRHGYQSHHLPPPVQVR